jgi:hypothetical protein
LRVAVYPHANGLQPGQYVNGCNDQGNSDRPVSSERLHKATSNFPAKISLPSQKTEMAIVYSSEQADRMLRSNSPAIIRDG